MHSSVPSLSLRIYERTHIVLTLMESLLVVCRRLQLLRQNRVERLPFPSAPVPPITTHPPDNPGTYEGALAITARLLVKTAAFLFHVPAFAL